MSNIEELNKFIRLILREEIDEDEAIHYTLEITTTLNRDKSSPFLKLNEIACKTFICPEMIIISRPSDKGDIIEILAKRMLYALKTWKVDNVYKNTSRNAQILQLEKSEWKSIFSDDNWVLKNTPKDDWNKNNVTLERAFKLMTLKKYE